MAETTILLYARTGAGKTTQIGMLAEDVFARTGKKTRLYTADSGSYASIKPYENLGIIEIVPILNTDPWLFADRAAKGYVRNSTGKWAKDPKANEAIGMYAFESAHSLADLMKTDMEKKAADGINVGGDTNTSFEVKDSASGESLKIGTTKGYNKFSIPQQRIWEAMMESQKLPAEYVLWTAGVDKSDDQVAVNKIVGPDVLGHALTGKLPMNFAYTIRMDVLPAADGKSASRHLMYLGVHKDVNAANATALGNIRRPLDAPKLETTIIEPANIVTALKVIRHDAIAAAEAAIAKRLNLSTHAK